MKVFGVGIPHEQFSHLFFNDSGRTSMNGTSNETLIKGLAYAEPFGVYIEFNLTN